MISPWMLSLTQSYPNPSEWGSFGALSREDVYRFVRLWLCEGIPFAFSRQPAVYEIARERLAQSLGLHPKDVSMTGSGRLGFSLAGYKFGSPYDVGRSDFDLFVVSQHFFEALSRDAKLFVDRYATGLAKPRTAAETKFWPENTKRLTENTDKGFVDQKLIPNVDQYPAAQRCYRGCYAFAKAVQDLHNLHKAPQVSVRVYSDWGTATRQIVRTVVYSLRKAGYEVA